MSNTRLVRRLGASALVACAAALAGCGESTEPVVVEPPQLAVTGAPVCTNTTPEIDKFKIIKRGGSGEFTVEVFDRDGKLLDTRTVTVDEGDCAWVLDNPNTNPDERTIVKVTETSGTPELIERQIIAIDQQNPGGDPILGEKESFEGTNMVEGPAWGQKGTVVWFHNMPPCTGKLGDFIWKDLNANGIQDDGEPGIAGVTVTLTDKSTGVQQMTETDVDGIYLFTGLCAGEYNVDVDEEDQQVDNLMLTLMGQGDDMGKDSNEDPSMPILETDDDQDLTIDFGFKCTGRMGDFIWDDLDGDGIQDPGEPGIAGVKVTLTNKVTGAQVMTETDGSGMYLFENLCADDYNIDVDESTLPAGFMQTPTEQGDDRTIDNNPNPFMLTLPGDNAEDLTIDFGYEGPEACLECKGGVIELTLRYNGTEAAQVRIESETIVFDQMVSPGEQFTIFGDKDDGRFTKDIKVFVDGEEQAKIHTSCSKPIGPGAIFGRFEVIRAVSKDNGVVCPVPECQECKGGVIQLTLRYNGTEAAQVRIESEGVVFDQAVNPGEEFTILGDRNEGKFKNDIKVFVNDVEQTKIHTSCSQPIGPGTVWGQFEVVEAISKDNGKVCPVDGGDPGGTSCDDGKPQVLVMRYTGESCSASDNTQDPDKASCDGDPAGADPVLIRASDKKEPDDNKAKVWFQAQVALNGTFDVDATVAGEDDLKSNTWIHIFTADGLTLLQTLQIHTSCSQPLNVGDQFGSVVLDEFVPKP